jgi:hypothetical protein
MTCSLILDLPPMKERANKDVYAPGDSSLPVAAKLIVISGMAKTSRSRGESGYRSGNAPNPLQ